jgi:hypothetical protein
MGWVIRQGMAVKFLSSFGGRVATGLVCVLVFGGGLLASAKPEASAKVVTYEEFGAIGDGMTDDLPAICKAHEHANENGLRVRTNPDATYHLGTKALTAVIQTDTDWGTSKFIIDDSKGVENNARALFEVRSRLEPVQLKIDRLARGQARLDVPVAQDCLVLVENKNRKMYIRRGLNQNVGTNQKEVFILRKNGVIEGVIDWDYDVVTQVIALPIDPDPLVVRGGIFTSIANQMKNEKGSSYWGRNIQIRRSNTEINGVTHRVTGETDIGQPYGGFLNVQRCASIVLRDCRIDARRTYMKIGSAGKPVPMGTYGYQASEVMDFRMIGCRMEDIHDRTRWGVTATNFMKNFLVEDCVLSRVDVHMGISGSYIIRRSTIGHGGINAIGRGRLLVEDSTLHGGSLVSFRSDYGSTWDGEVDIRNSRWLPPRANAAMFVMNNDGMHDFGYPCSMPRVVRIEGLEVEDSKIGTKHRGISFFNDPVGASGKTRPFPYRLTERLEVSGLRIASGLKPQISSNPELVKAIRYIAR